MNSMEFCPKMGHSTELNDLFCKTVYILTGFHSCSQLQPGIQPDPIISRPPPVRDPNYVQNFSAYERVYTVSHLYLFKHIYWSHTTIVGREVLSRTVCPKNIHSSIAVLLFNWIFTWLFFNTVFVSSHMYPENPEGTPIIVGSMNIGYISDTARNQTHNLFRLKWEQIPLGHSDGHSDELIKSEIFWTTVYPPLCRIIARAELNQVILMACYCYGRSDLSVQCPTVNC